MFVNIVNDHYGDRIRSERRRLEMTQTQFAQATGISQATQVGYENGAHLPNVHYLNRASALGVDIVFVVLGKRTPQAAVDWVDWDTFLRIVAAIDEWLETNLLTVDQYSTVTLEHAKKT